MLLLFICNLLFFVCIAFVYMYVYKKELPAHFKFNDTTLNTFDDVSIF